MNDSLSLLVYYSLINSVYSHHHIPGIVCVMLAVSSVDKISDCYLEGPGFDSRLGHGAEYLGDLLSPHCPWTGT